MNKNISEMRENTEQHINRFNPYETVPSIRIDLVELTRYAKKNNKKLKELSEDEVSLFRR